MLRTVSALVPLALASSGCSNSSSSTSSPPPHSGAISATVTPPAASIRSGDSYTFSAQVTGSTNTAVLWSVNFISGGNSTLGTVDASGNYISPAAVPTPNSVTLTATSAADASKYSSSTITLLTPTPVFTGISPASSNLGTFSLTVTGSKFLSGAVV